MPRLHDLYSHLHCPHHGGIKVVDLNPKQHTIPLRLGGRITNWAVMMLHIPPVQLENQPIAGY
jgi:hypothetical protein